VKSMMSICVRFSGGDAIADACVDACALATKLGCWVEFKFNDVQCMAAPHSDPVKLADAQQRVQDSDSRYKLVVAHSDDDIAGKSL
jgi:Zn ribbon nucleic-acid-binding protein